MAITPKDFIQFFEKELGETGKRILDEIVEAEKKKTCEFCQFGSRGDGKWVHKDDIVCVNDKSDRCTDFVSSKDKCDKWQKRETEENN